MRTSSMYPCSHSARSGHERLVHISDSTATAACPVAAGQERRRAIRSRRYDGLHLRCGWFSRRRSVPIAFNVGSRDAERFGRALSRCEAPSGSFGPMKVGSDECHRRVRLGGSIRESSPRDFLKFYCSCPRMSNVSRLLIRSAGLCSAVELVATYRISVAMQACSEMKLTAPTFSCSSE